MPISIRLGDELEQRLAIASRKLRLNKSELIKRSLEAYLDRLQLPKSPYQLGEDLFGADDSKDASASASYKMLLKKKLGEKHHR
jgi:predicted DNA-binding protein